MRTTLNEVICPLSVILLENQCIQMKSEEQDEIDRAKIAMYGKISTEKERS